jgi:hypothetical protein
MAVDEEVVQTLEAFLKLLSKYRVVVLVDTIGSRATKTIKIEKSDK